MSHYKPYPVYKESGLEWLGRVPEHWHVKRLKFIATVQTGVAKGKDNEGRDTIEVPYLRVANVQDGYLALDDIATIAIPREDLLRYSLRPGDVLMNEGGDFDKLGRGHVWQGEIEPCIHQNHVFAVRPAKVPPYWLNAFTGSKAAQFYFMGRSKQSTNLASISSSNVMELPVVVPPDNELPVILAHLDRETARIDALVEKKSRFIELLREKRQALITHAVTKGLNPNVKMKDSGVEWLGDVPKHWSIKPFKACIDFQEGPGIMAVDFHNEGVPLLRVSGVQDRWASLEGCNYLDLAKVARQWKHFRLESGDLLISASASMGTVCEVAGDSVGAIAYTGLIRLRGKKDLMLKPYIRSLVVSSLFSVQIELFKAGSTIQHFGPTHLSQMLVVCPPVNEQAAIAEHIEQETKRIDGLITKSEQSVEFLTERRAALITAAVTGQIDLREAV